MAIIPLRAYNREIEGLIDNGQLDEAVAHCRHILATFPKNIASYRLLGKAHLEQQRISDATDIFQRVLTAIPDDFISNVGMSIIREDENNLDAAIWHMEMAYEAQPANIAIQDELRRLYGRRDGMQPPKVRLTRGALARMYAKGGLYDQAIAELKAAITEDPNRSDLQLLLAQMFFQTSQRVESVDTCVNILKKIPLCLEANRILAVSLPEAEGSDAVKNYRQTVISMDPYYAFAENDAISSDQVPENAVNIERLEYKSGLQIGDTTSQPSWATSLGVSVEKPVEENIPDWLKSAEAPPTGPIDANAAPVVSPFIWDTQEVEKIITDTSKPEGDIPDWMKDAGWKPASGQAAPPEEGAPAQETTSEAQPGGDIEPGDIPDWLKGIAPDGMLGEEKPASQPEEGGDSNPWLEPKQPGPTDSIIQWLDEKKPGPAASSGAEGSAGNPDDEVPDWLKDLDLPPSTLSQEGQAGEPSAFTFPPPAFTEETVLSQMPQAQASPLDFGKTGDIEPPAEEPIIPSEISAAPESSDVFAEEVPDWLREIAEETPEAPVTATTGEASPETTGPTEPEAITEAAPGAEELPPPPLQEVPETPPAAREQAVAEELQAPGELPIIEETLPAEVAGAVEPLSEAEAPAVEELPAIEMAPAPAETPTAELTSPVEAPAEAEIPTITEELPVSEVETPTEALAPAEQPVQEEEIPDWMKAETIEIPAEEQLPVTTEPLVSEEAVNIPSEIPAAETPALEEIPPSAEIPQVSPEQPEVEQPAAVQAETAAEAPAQTGEAIDLTWLEGFIGEQAPEESQLIEPSAEGDLAPPEWVKLESEPLEGPAGEEIPETGEIPAVSAEEIPDWIKGLGEEPEGETEAAAEEIPAEAAPPEALVPPAEQLPAEELPAWLVEMEQPAPEEGVAEVTEEVAEWKPEELPQWLKEITEEAEPEPITGVTRPLHAVEIPEPAQEAVAQPETEMAVPIEAVPVSPTGEVPQAVVEAPATEETSQVVAAAPVEAEDETAAVMEEVPEKAVEAVPAIAEEHAAVPEVMVSETQEALFTSARTALDEGQPAQAVEFYSELIKQNYRVTDIIRDMQEALGRFPVDIPMWISLGDAHQHTNNLQEALNAYTKAEELAR